MSPADSMPVDGEIDALPGVAAELARGIENGLHHGGQICVTTAGRTIADAAFGQAAPGVPMTRDHRMLWLSSSKPLTAVAVAQLWQRGALRLDDPVARFLPEFAAGGKSAVTIRHLLTHTAGIRRPDTGWPEASWDEIVAGICARRLEPGWIPGRRAGYHLTSSWFVLGELVRRVDGRPIARYLREELFVPLGMHDTSLGVAPEDWPTIAPVIAPMYVRIGRALGKSDLTSEAKLVRPSPGGNAVGPIRQLARFYALLLAGGELDGRRLLAPQTVEAIVARHRVGMVDRTFRAKLDWGLGFILDSAHYGEENAPYGYGPDAGPRTFGHSGARSSVAFCDPDARLVVALAVNGLADEATHRERTYRLLAALYRDLGLSRPPE